MNWEKINKKYPKTIKLLESWGNYPSVLSRQKVRLLYDFFDENGFYVVLRTIKWERKKGFTYDIYTSFNEHDYSWGGGMEGFSENRSVSEIVAFTKAFEMLERKL